MLWRLFLIFCFVPIASAPGQYDGWWLNAEPCARQEGATLIMECISTGYVSPEYDMTIPIRVSVELRAWSMTNDPRFWAGLALNSDIAGDDQYAQIAISHGIAPYWGDTQAYAVHLSTPADRCCERIMPVDSRQWHTLTIEYEPGRATYTFDGVARTVAIDLGPRAAIELLCVADDPGVGKPGVRARCEWRNLRVSPYE